MFSISTNSARIDNNVVNVPVPAIKGKAMGTTLAVEEESSLKNRIPNFKSYKKNDERAGYGKIVYRNAN